MIKGKELFTMRPLVSSHGKRIFSSCIAGACARAELAGTAMGCHYLSSAEYDAALIAERRLAGAYGPPLWRRARPWIACVLVGVALSIGLPLVW